MSAPFVPMQPVDQEIAALERMLAVSEETAERAQIDALPLWTPQRGPQTAAWESDCPEILYGGEPGGGKSALAAALPLQYMDAPRARLLVLRRNTTHLAELIDEAKDIFIRGNTSGSFKFRPAAPSVTRFREDKSWLLINGGRIRVWFGHCADSDSWQIYHGQAYDRVVFDELPQFEEEQYVEIRSRIRGKVPGLRRGSLATANPPKPTEPGATWVRRRWGPWLDTKWVCPDWQRADSTGAVVIGRGLPTRPDAPPAASGQVLYVARAKDGDLFSTEPFTWEGEPAQGRTFIRARLSDNAALTEADPGYRGRLMDNDPVRVQQLLNGDWMVSYSTGEMFRRTRFEIVSTMPPGQATWARAWDFAGTKPNEQNKDPDWTVGLKGCRHEDGYIYVAHGHAMRDEPGEVEAMRAHYVQADGPMVKQLYPRDPAEAGKTMAQLRVTAAIDAGTDADMVPTAKNVLSKAGAVSAAAHPRALGKPDEPGNYGKIRVVQGDWNGPFFDCLEGFPKVRHDDWVSAFADLYNYLMSAPGWTPPVPVQRLPSMRLSRGRGFG
jgi:phage terminase large subunit-like protein